MRLSTLDQNFRLQRNELRTIRAGDYLVSWAAHDMLRFSRIAKRIYQMIRCDSEAYAANHAGSRHG